MYLPVRLKQYKKVNAYQLTETCKKSFLHLLRAGRQLCYSSTPAAKQRGGERKGQGRTAVFLKRSDKKTIDARQQVPHNLASLLLTNTTLRGSRPGKQCLAGGRPILPVL